MNADASEPPNQETPPQLNRFRMDRRIWLFVILAMIGASIFVLKDHEAFPEASIDLKLSKQDVAALCVNWARRLGYHKNKLIESTMFTWDDNAKTFLELEMGSARANELMKSTVPIWFWHTRLCKEFDPEQFTTYIGPTGELAYMQLTIENDKQLPSLTQSQAQAFAANFIEKEAKVSLADYTLVQSSSDNLPKRVDHSFMWEDNAHDYKDAHMRIYVNVSGNTITYYYRFLHVPELWQRKFNTIRSYNELLGRFAFVFNSLLYLAASFIFVWAVSTRHARWKFGIGAGAICSIGVMLLSLNNMPQVIDNYSPTSGFAAYLIGYFLQAIGGGLVAGLFAGMLIIAGEAMYRLTYPKNISFESFFKIRSYGSAQVSRGLIVGICMFAIALGWVVTYYLLGTHFGSNLGFWCPLDVSNYKVLSTCVPAYGAVCIGVEAAFNEELLYRVIGLGLAKKLVRNFWLANLLQALAWGFAHSTYPQQPAYARGVELTLSGLLFGWICNTFGLLPCLVAHYLLDAFLTAQTLLGSGNPLLLASGLAPVLPFPVLALFSVARASKQPIDETALLNEAIVVTKLEPKEAQPHQKFVYDPLSKRVRIALLVTTALSVIVGLSFGHLSEIGSRYKVDIGRDAATKQAWEVLAAHNIPVDQKDRAKRWSVVAWLAESISSEEMQYLYEHLHLPKTLELADDTQPGYYWRVRFFRPMQAEEYEVDIDGSGKELDFDTTLPEDAAGASLSEAQARAIAERNITEKHSKYMPFVFDSTTRTARKNRVDYTFTFKVAGQKVADAESKLTQSVIGSNLSEFSQGWNLPDQWKWERNKHGWREEVLTWVRIGAMLVLGVMALWWVIGLLRVGYLPFRPALIFGAAMTLFYLPESVNDLCAVFSGYQTTMPLSTFQLNQAIKFIESIMSRLGEYGLIMLIALPCARLLLPTTNPLSLISTTFRPAADERAVHKELWLDAILIAYTAVAVGFFLGELSKAGHLMISPAEQEAYLGSVSSLANTFFPGLSIIVNVVSSSVAALIVIPIGVGFYAKYLKKFSVYFVFVVGANLIMSSGDRYWQDYLISGVLSAIYTCLVWVFVAKLARRNILTYLLTGMFFSLLTWLSGIIQHAPRLFFADAVAFGILLLLPAAYAGYTYCFRRPTVALDGGAFSEADSPDK